MYINNDLFHSLVDLVSFKFLRFFEVKAKIHHHKNLNQKPKIKPTSMQALGGTEVDGLFIAGYQTGPC